MIYNPSVFSSLPADIRQNVIRDHEGNTPHRHGCNIALVKADDNFTIFIQIKRSIVSDGFKIPFRHIRIQPVTDIFIRGHLRFHLFFDLVILLQKLDGKETFL